eukprot:768473-Hanusia_phi.AAC.18
MELELLEQAGEDDSCLFEGCSAIEWQHCVAFEDCESRAMQIPCMNCNITGRPPGSKDQNEGGRAGKTSHGARRRYASEERLLSVDVDNRRNFRSYIMQRISTTGLITISLIQISTEDS